MSKPATSETVKPALVVVTEAAPLSNRAQLARFQKTTVDALRYIEKSDILTTRRKVMIGFALHCIKASVKHGEFLPWLKANVTGKGYAQVNFYMRAATACAETMQLGAPDLHALPTTKINALKLEVRHTDGFQGKVATFCGELTFNELLDKHGIKEIKKLGGARTAGTAAPEATPDAETLYLQSRDELSAAIARAETLFIGENRLQHLAGHPDEVRGAVTALRDLADRVEAAAKPILKN